jgi:hypothetical protein
MNIRMAVSERCSQHLHSKPKQWIDMIQLGSLCDMKRLGNGRRKQSSHERLLPKKDEKDKCGSSEDRKNAEPP